MMPMADLVAGWDRSAWMGAVYVVAWESCVGQTFTVGDVELFIHYRFFMFISLFIASSVHSTKCIYFLYACWVLPILVIYNS